MRYLIILFLAVTYSNAQVTEFINFKVVSGNRLVWQQVYEEDLDIENQELRLSFQGKKSQGSIWLQNCDKAFLTVERKDGRTRLTVGDISSYVAISMNFGGVRAEPKRSYAGEVFIKPTGELRKIFMGRNGGQARLLHQMITSEIDRLLNAGENDDDW